MVEVNSLIVVEMQVIQAHQVFEYYKRYDLVDKEKEHRAVLPSKVEVDVENNNLNYHEVIYFDDDDRSLLLVVEKRMLLTAVQLNHFQ